MNNGIKKELTEHMRDFGIHMIARGVVNATFSEMDNPYSHAMSVVHVAHGTEIIFKAKIAEEHPLLIFSKFPKSKQLANSKLDILDLLDSGQTIMYSELPERLWATTDYKIEKIDLYNEFGKIRNQLIHFAVPNIELCDITLKFTFEIVEKAINTWWDDTILNYATNYDDVYLEYAFEQFDRLGIETNYKLNENFKLEKKIK